MRICLTQIDNNPDGWTSYSRYLPLKFYIETKIPGYRLIITAQAQKSNTMWRGDWCYTGIEKLGYTGTVFKYVGLDVIVTEVAHKHA